MKSLKNIILIISIASISGTLLAQTGPPGPATGAPIDGISGLIMMALAAIFGKKFIDKK